MSKEHRTHYKNIKINKLPHSEAEITGEIEAAALEEARTAALRSLGERVNIPGFRKGHIPENVIVEKIGEQALMEEAAEIALGHEYQHIVLDQKLDVVGRPQITLTKLARGNDLGFKILVPLFPEVKISDYKKIATKELKEIGKEKIIVTDEDVEKVVAEIKKSYAQSIDDTDASGDKKETVPSLPELTDEFVKKLGDFADVADFKKKLTENILKEKEGRAVEKKRMRIIDKIVDATVADLPEIFIENELVRMKTQFGDDLARMGIKFDDYLKQIKKTEEVLRTEWRKDAERRVLLQIVINKIAIAENINPDQKEVENEVAHLATHHKDADKDRLRGYVEMMLVNEEVFKFLEKLEETGAKEEKKQTKKLAKD